MGGGPAGLGAAVCAQENGVDWHLFEREDRWGGLSASFRDAQGFTWDLGGHILFSHYGNFDRQMDKVIGPRGWIDHERESWVWVRNRFIPYPFQNNLHRLDSADRSACVEGLRVAAKAAQAKGGQTRGRPADFGEWIVSTLGSGIADLFMKPYNWKVWAHPLDQMDCAWLGERVAVPAIEEVLKSIETGKDNVSWGPNKLFRFPVTGGTGAIWQAVASRLPGERLSLGHEIISVDAKQKTMTGTNGEAWSYRHCISTIPLDRLVRISGSDNLAPAAGRLASTSTYVVGVGVDGNVPSHLKTKCWMYFPQSNSPYYRVTVFSNYSPNNVANPGKQWSLMAEVSESRFKAVDRNTLEKDTLRALQEDGLLPDRKRVVSTISRHVPQSYPVPFLGRDAAVGPMLLEFEKRDIFSRGRMGAWKYEVGNQDHSYQQGYECVQRIVNRGGAEYEPTLNNPDQVNAPGKRK